MEIFEVFVAFGAVAGGEAPRARKARASSSHRCLRCGARRAGRRRRRRADLPDNRTEITRSCKPTANKDRSSPRNHSNARTDKAKVGQKIGQTNEKIRNKNKRNEVKILLACNAGMSTSLLVQKMKKELSKHISKSEVDKIDKNTKLFFHRVHIFISL